MSIPFLVEVYDEMRRLAIAGSAVAPGDFRLKKLIGPLQKAGEKAPVFAKVAQAVQAVVDSDEKTAAVALLELTTLVNAILYTQGETGMAGELKAMETTDLGGAAGGGGEATQASARMLKPLLEALSSTGSGRLEVIRDAQESGAFRDFRLVKPALRALDDSYSEIGDLMAEKVLPVYGKAILPELRATLNIKERGGGQVHRLRLLHQIDPVGSRDVVQLALAEGSKEMKVAAVECLGTTQEDVAYLLEQAKSKAKDVRAAALRAMAAAEGAAEGVIGAVKSAIDGADLGLIIERLRRCVLPGIRDYVLEQAEKQLAETLALKDAKLQGPAIERLQQLVLSLEGRTDAGAEGFLLNCFEKGAAFGAMKSEPSGADLNELVARVMVHGTPRMQQVLVGAHPKLKGAMLSSAIYAARVSMLPGDFYREFSPLLKGYSEAKARKGIGDTDRGALLVMVLETQGRLVFHPHGGGVRILNLPLESPLPELDARWLDAAVEAKAAHLVCRLARPGHGAANAFLSAELGEIKKSHDTHFLLQTMVRIGHPEAADAVIETLQKVAKESTHYYVGYWIGRMIVDLPKSTLPKFEALLPTLPEKMVDQLMDSVLALKNKPE